LCRPAFGGSGNSNSEGAEGDFSCSMRRSSGLRTLVTLELLQEARQFDLRYTCDDCVHFVGGASGERCAHGYPLGERRERVLRPGDDLAFCKEFEG
jgi:hypothetical protein